MYFFPFLDLFCVHLQGVPGSRGLPGADGRAGVMVRLLSGSLFLNNLLLYICDAFCHLCLILCIYFGRDLLVTVVLVVLLVLRVLVVMVAVLVSLVLWVQE